MADRVTVLGPGAGPGDFLTDLEQSSADAAALEARAKRAHGRPVSTGAGCRQLKLECTSCGCIVRMSRGALERSGAPTCGCGAGALELEAELEAERQSCEESRELERVSVAAMRRDSRERSSGYQPGAWRCKGCGRFRSRPTEQCACGDSLEPYGPDSKRESREVNRAHGYAD